MQGLPEGQQLWDCIHPKNKDGTPKYNPAGRYTVRVFHQDEWKALTVDDTVRQQQHSCSHSA